MRVDSARLHGEVYAAGLPFLGDLDGQGGNEAQQRVLVGEQRGNAGSSLDLLVEPFGAVGST